MAVPVPALLEGEHPEDIVVLPMEPEEVFVLWMDLHMVESVLEVDGEHEVPQLKETQQVLEGLEFELETDVEIEQTHVNDEVQCAILLWHNTD